MWTDFTEASKAKAKADEFEYYTLGIVRSSKEKPTFGLRTWVKDYDRMWQALKPTVPKPDLIQGEFLYKLTPVPEGATFEDVQRWIHLEKLAARPLRALSTTTWLLLGQSKIERQHLTWQRGAVMLKPVESR